MKEAKREVRVTYDPECNMGYIALTPVEAGGAVRQVEAKGVSGCVVLDFDAAGMLLGIEVFNASVQLPSELLP